MSSKAKVVPFQPGHTTLIELRQHEAELLDIEHLSQLGQIGRCGTLMCDGRILAIIGFNIVFPGVLYVFFIPSIWAPLYALPFVRTAKQYVHALWNNAALNVHRMETRSKADDQTDKWMRILGFECEGTHFKYTQNQVDYRTWAKVKRNG